MLEPSIEQQIDRFLMESHVLFWKIRIRRKMIMADPLARSPGVRSFLNNVLGRDQAAVIKKDKCVFCGCMVKEFRDERSEREYTISGLCQKCQDLYLGVQE